MTLQINLDRIALDDIDFSKKTNPPKKFFTERRPVTSGLNSISSSSLSGVSTTGYTVTSANSSVAVSSLTGRIRITGNGGLTPNGVVTAALDTIPGNYYYLFIDRHVGSYINTLTLDVGVKIPSTPLDSDKGSLLGNSISMISNYTDKFAFFQALTDITYINIGFIGNNSSAYAEFDNLSLMDVTVPNDVEVISINGRFSSSTYQNSLFSHLTETDYYASGYDIISDGFKQYIHFPTNEINFYISSSSDYGYEGDGSLFIEGITK